MATSTSPVVGLRAVFQSEIGIDIRLYYGTRDNLVQELTYASVNKSWHSGFSFAMSNGNGGIALRQSNTTLYMICLNSAYELEIWWKHLNEFSVVSPADPIGVWTRGM